MPKNHEQVILDLEHRLFAALIAVNTEELKIIFHENAIYTSEYGETFHGTSSFPPDDGLFKINFIKVVERTVTFFTNVAIVNSIEFKVVLITESKAAANYAAAGFGNLMEKRGT